MASRHGFVSFVYPLDSRTFLAYNDVVKKNQELKERDARMDTRLVLAVLWILGVMVGCDGAEPRSTQQNSARESASGSKTCSGKVIETADSGGYTYVNVDCGGRTIWAAGPETQVEVGEQVTVQLDMPMSNFESKTLNRTFETIYFAAEIRVAGRGGEPGSGGTSQQEMLAKAHGSSISAGESDLDFSGIQKPGGGLTIAEIFAAKDELSGQEILVRGKVVKFNSQILGTNWIHLRDGTGTEGADDLTVTTTDTAKVGDTVLAKGKLALDRDFGFGYRYEVMIEKAAVTVE
jgi:hypothetical protein